MLKALIMAVLGLLAGTVGMDPISGEERFTYGTLTLRDGLGLCRWRWDFLAWRKF